MKEHPGKHELLNFTDCGQKDGNVSEKSAGSKSIPRMKSAGRVILGPEACP